MFEFVLDVHNSSYRIHLCDCNWPIEWLAAGNCADLIARRSPLHAAGSDRSARIQTICASSAITASRSSSWISQSRMRALANFSSRYRAPLRAGAESACLHMLDQYCARRLRCTSKSGGVSWHFELLEHECGVHQDTPNWQLQPPDFKQPAGAKRARDRGAAERGAS